MLTLYIVCLIIGGALVALSVFAGGDAGLELDADIGADASTDAPTETVVDVNGTGDAGSVQGEGVAAAAQFLSLRNGVFFAAFFGLTGTLLSLVGIGSPITAVVAVGIGLLAAVSLHRMMEYLRQSETGELPGPGTLEGALAEVVVDVDDEHPGKVAVRGGDRTVQLVARLHESAETRRFHTGDEVVIVDFEGGIARIAGTRFLA